MTSRAWRSGCWPQLGRRAGDRHGRPGDPLPIQHRSRHRGQPVHQLLARDCVAPLRTAASSACHARARGDGVRGERREASARPARAAASGSKAQIAFPDEVACSGQRRRYSIIACMPRSVGSRSRNSTSAPWAIARWTVQPLTSRSSSSRVFDSRRRSMRVSARCPSSNRCSPRR